MEELLKAIAILVAEELQRGYKKKGPFVDAHHGYASMLEEIEEARDEMEVVYINKEIAWSDVKKDCAQIETYENIKQAAMNAAAEFIQAAAMAQKNINMLAREDQNGPKTELCRYKGGDDLSIQ
ncbi:MAG: hypothetical protein AB9836_04905 [Aminipila sp.]